MRTQSVAWGRRVLPSAMLFLLGLFVALPLWGPGFLNTRGGGDSPFLLLRVHQLTADLRAGHFPARWMPDAAYGLGYPFFNYYAALPYYLAAILHLLGIDLLGAIKLAQTVFSVAAPLAAYGWARRHVGGRAAAWLVGVAYAVAPFHLVNLYVRGDSFSEFAAFAFYPLLLWGLDHLAEEPEARRVAFPALAYGGLVLTHNISALIFSPFALLYFLAQVGRARVNRRRLLILGVAAFGLGLALAAGFWIPALLETDLVQLTAQTTGYFFYGGHFRGANLVQRSLLFDYEIGEGRTPFAMGLVQAAVTALGVVVLLARWVRYRRVRWIEGVGLAGLVLSTWMITPLSRPLWDHLPLLPMVQFPWRFLSIQSLFTALTVGTLVADHRGSAEEAERYNETSLRAPRLPDRATWPMTVVLALSLTVAGLGDLRPDYIPIAAEEFTAEQLQLYEMFTGNVGSTIRYEYLPREVVPRPWTGPSLFDPDRPPGPRPLEGTLLAAYEVVHEPVRRVWEVTVGEEGGQIAFPLYWWPGWRATVDGEPAAVGPAPDSGWATVPVPPGRHTVTLRLGHTPLRAGAEGVSLLAAGVLLLLLISPQRHRGHGGFGLSSLLKRVSVFPVPLWLSLLCALCILCALPLLAPRYEARGEGDLTMDFEQMPLLHHNPGGLDFGPVRLLRYEYSTDRPAPGGSLRLTMEWSGETEGLTLTVRLVSPAVHLRHLPDGWAKVQVPLRPRVEVVLPVPEGTSPGPSLVAVGVEGPEGGLSPRLPSGRTLGTIYLRPVWVQAVEPPPDEMLAVWADGTVRLHRVRTSQPTPTLLEVRLDWSATRPPVGNWGVNLRLIDPAGNEWARLDVQPGYGFLPTGLWPVGRRLPDRYLLPLPDGTPPGSAYTLEVTLYRMTTWEKVGAIAQTVPLTQTTFRPDAPVRAALGGGLALSRMEVPGQVQQGETLRWTAWWLVRGEPRTAQAEWRLEGPTVLSATLPLAPGSDPADWPVGAWVAGKAALRVPPDAPPGSYTLILTLLDADGRPLGVYTHPRAVEVEGRARVWELPPMEREVGATFGGMIELAGYDLEREGATLRLTLHWRALTTPDRDYKFFVHVADPATARPVAQMDGMPRGYTYPTGRWVAGEVVSDPVEVSLEGVPPGEYELAVGWYDPETGERLEARDAAGDLLPDGRVVLPDRIKVP